MDPPCEWLEKSETYLQSWVSLCSNKAADCTAHVKHRMSKWICEERIIGRGSTAKPAILLRRDETEPPKRGPHRSFEGKLPVHPFFTSLRQADGLRGAEPLKPHTLNPP